MSLLKEKEHVLDCIVSYLNVPQKLYRPIKAQPADLSQYPVEFLYLTRILLD